MCNGEKKKTQKIWSDGRRGKRVEIKDCQVASKGTNAEEEKKYQVPKIRALLATCMGGAIANTPRNDGVAKTGLNEGN